MNRNLPKNPYLAKLDADVAQAIERLNKIDEQRAQAAAHVDSLRAMADHYRAYLATQAPAQMSFPAAAATPLVAPPLLPRPPSVEDLKLRVGVKRRAVLYAIYEATASGDWTSNRAVHNATKVEPDLISNIVWEDQTKRWLIERKGEAFRITERGRAFVERLKQVEREVGYAAPP